MTEVAANSSAALQLTSGALLCLATSLAPYPSVPLVSRSAFLTEPQGGKSRFVLKQTPSLIDSNYAINYATIRGMTTMIEELMISAADARRVAQNALRVAVREARAADWSWDRISAALGGTPNGETLRRNFGSDEEHR